MTQIDPSMGPVEAIAPTTLWNTGQAVRGGKSVWCPHCNILLSMGPSTARDSQAI